MSELSVGQLKGLPVNSNVVTVPAGNTLYAPGHVVQTVHASYSTTQTSTSNTLINTGLTATITPKFASSKILVLVDQGGAMKGTGDAGNWLQVRLYRDAVELERQLGGYTGTNMANYFGAMNFNYLDSPNTTSAVTYKTMFANIANASYVQVQESSTPSHMTLMEIAA
jgi:hypothetical protein